jgi:hypothetical protein
MLQHGEAIRRCSAALAVALAMSIRVTAAGPLPAFDFHGDSLGETFADFQQAHSASGIRCRGDMDALRVHGLPEPSSSDLVKLPDLGDSRAGALMCGVRDFQTVAHVPARFVEYFFVADKLFRIRAITGDYPNAYVLIKSAYVDRYGNPMTTGVDAYQNRLGAIFNCEHSIWLDSTRGYQLTVSDHVDWVRIDMVDTRADAAQRKLQPKAKDDL